MFHYLNIIPYKGNETLIFKDSIGDSLVYEAEGRSSGMYRYYRDPSNVGYKGASDYYDYERNTTNFKHGSNLIIEFSNPFLSNKIMKYFLTLYLYILVLMLS